MPQEVGDLVFWTWLLASALPPIEGAILLRKIQRPSRASIMLVLLGAFLLSAATLVPGLWLIPSLHVSNAVKWNQGLDSIVIFVICFHIGALVMLVFRDQITRWFESHPPN